MRWILQFSWAAYCLWLLLAPAVVSAEETPLDCGMARGYPPYQYLDAQGKPAGLDAEVAKLVLARLGVTGRVLPGDWDDVVASLRLGRLDFVCGMEINHDREHFFAFTTPYYTRKVVIFVRRDETGFKSVEDLVGKAVAGDRHSFVEHYLKELGLLDAIRIIRTRTKDQSMRMLKDGKVVAVIAPLAVGRLLAGRQGMPVRVIDVGDPGSPVGFAVEKSNDVLLKRLENALEELKREGALQPVLDRWLH
ncbi:transporter substrate-binding domain-containing protein [Pseudodesulfovibrio karagichevae]|uniref:Transporter substrate-binding domain-containing protein n=1 Tax=Pseudodesulfovibrio karagichevae TaxID=3239305 RepID=A0ABV4K667_9BACT